MHSKTKVGVACGFGAITLALAAGQAFGATCQVYSTSWNQTKECGFEGGWRWGHGVGETAESGKKKLGVALQTGRKAVAAAINMNGVVISGCTVQDTTDGSFQNTVWDNDGCNSGVKFVLQVSD